MSLRTSGIQLVDASGRPFRLRGTMMGMNEKFYGLNSVPTNWTSASTPEDSWFNESDYQRLKSAGANCIELQCFRLGDFIPNKIIDQATEQQCSVWVDKYAQWTAANGIYSIIDIGGLGWWGVPNPAWAVPQFPPWLWEQADPPYPAPTTQQEYEAIRRDWFDVSVARQESNRQAFINLWGFLANRYKNNPYVLFSPMNEPNLNNGATAESYSNIMTRTFDAIRNAGAPQLVFINFPYYAIGGLFPINRDIVWEDHVYMGDSHEPSLDSWKARVDSFVQKYNTDFGKPFFVAEYGIDPPSDIRTQFASNWQQILTEMVAKLDSSPTVGRLWYSHADFAWKQAPWNPAEIAYEQITLPPDQYTSGFAPPFFTFEESDWVKKLVLAGTPEVTLPLHDNFATLDSKWQKINGIWSIV